MAVLMDELFEPEDRPFRGALAVLTLAAGAFVAWVASTPPRVELDVVDVGVVAVLVADLPRIELPDPVVVAPLAPGILDPWEPRRATRERGGARDDVGSARVEGDPEGPSEGRSLLVERIGKLDPDDVLATVFREDLDRVALDEALRGVRDVGEARADGGVRRARREGDVERAVGILGGGSAAIGGAGVRLKTTPEEADVEVDAGDAAEIARVMRASQGRFLTCVERSLLRDPAMQGRVALGWSIAAGRVRDVRIVSDTTGDPDLAKCMAAAVRSVRFPHELTADVASFPWVVSGR